MSIGEHHTLHIRVDFDRLSRSSFGKPIPEPEPELEPEPEPEPEPEIP